MQYYRLYPCAFALACLLPTAAYCATDPPPPADSSAPASAVAVEPTPPQPAAPGKPPATIEADRIEGHQDKEVEAFGDVIIRSEDKTLSGDYMRYDAPSDEVYGKGHVQTEQSGSRMKGTELKLQLEKNIGHIDQAEYELTETHARGDAKRILFEGKDKYRAEDARYTTCPIGTDDWFLHVKDLEIDRTTQVGTARNAYIEFKGVPLLYSPWLTFPLNNQRKSGLLTPTFGSTGKSGAELTVPYYWNIAPNIDATISPRLMVRRGLQLNNELRYLQPNYLGEVRFETLPNDRVTGTSRYGFTIKHNQQIAPKWSGSLNVQKVSDDTYFTDLSDRISSTALTNLPREGVLSYTSDWWNLTGRVQRFQTLQDPLGPAITPPYQRAPQLLLNAARQNVYGGTDVNLFSEFVSFQHPTLLEGKRFIAYPSVSLPLTRSYGFVTPKLGWHVTRYSVEQSATANTNVTRSLPIFSVDSGLLFDRNWQLGEKNFLQTLEPRLYYLYIPYRDQSQLPNFDTADADFNFAQMFTENKFSGGDRVNDANQITLAVTSRLIEPDSGSERLRAAIGQRFYLTPPRVTLGTPARNGPSDILASFGGQITHDWRLDSGLQFNPSQNRTEKTALSLRYLPETGKVINFSYRYIRDPLTPLRQVDISTQWPLSGRWYGLVRYNYSLQDSKVLEALGGLEYNGGCWAVRGVVHRFATGTQQATNAIFIQLELNGVSKIGSSPIEVLKQNIPGYVKSNE